MNENLSNQQLKHEHSHIPMEKVRTEPQFENYTQKTEHFFKIDKQIDNKKRELGTVAQESVEKPTASKDAYTKLMGIVKAEIKELELEKERMMHPKKTIY
ncbi:MAG: hypothetical protein COV32_03245 [Candidatus Yonathbacteria bacterium CG10_big_fil_rev_8_21_14_0_10_43_136]|uniref:Uncharacterized protein n=2 Tax=Parcubacteria group TaxID=1794811 RepID=A0A2M7Q4L3_9BACT|nr:MAG: hypothetical protein AUK15_00440 [Candidatus Nomurabacteria bacterium CG2_30_43_9]PIQ36125.1 MAG: hypothetical protein COW60_00210 [Candidatus Yonathbacteria bacterium CG17_big_fil_post_rev_8_21_14_2_50_43_9]PIR40464.1 MAG: hypothetical protein COV32_03245 [Candidatus Yonathbacteria bacterium CG10_big_fil_rev_8_21_14_0_10_43_136]PIX56998.1 MAG: hypothetical protein COZ48_02980 [Candidatus Yonathbacteria bacterium CG_4_10_14_3_um_filter_43_12]PIY58149.1 MAG: hypothetical protein COY98_03